MNSRNFVNGPRWNGVICPKCGEDCFNTWGLIEHMKTYHSNRAPDWSSIFAAFLAIILAVSLFCPVRAQDTQPPSVGEPPTVAVEHKVFLPFISIDDGVDGRGRYWGGSAGQAEYVSWRPSGS